MSRTDKTKPLWVRAKEHGVRPTHDHRHGSCDLPPRPTREDTGTRCRWEPGALLFVGPCCSACGCRSCTREWQQWVKEGNRKERYAARRATRRHIADQYDD